jgi:hypothetical protein
MLSSLTFDAHSPRKAALNNPYYTAPPEVLPKTQAHDNICVICQEEICDNVVSLPCNHRFHGQCLCNHLVHDGRCPICRDSPYGNGYDSYDSFDEYDDEPHITTMKEAIKKAREDKTNKSTKRMLSTMKKWKQSKTQATRDMRDAWKKIKPLEEAMDKKVDDYEKKLRATLKKRHAKLYETQKNACKAMTKARLNLGGSKARIASRYGWVKRCYRSSRRATDSVE